MQLSINRVFGRLLWGQVCDRTRLRYVISVEGLALTGLPGQVWRYRDTFSLAALAFVQTSPAHSIDTRYRATGEFGISFWDRTLPVLE